MKFCIKKLHIRKLQERNFHNKRGQSLMEVILAMAIFSMISAVMATLAVGGFTALMQGGEQTEAEALAQEGIEAVRSIRDGAWNEINYNQSGVELSGGQWIFSGEGSSETIGQYTRTITFDAVCRDGSNNIVTCPGSYTDVQTKRATVTVSWTIRSGITNSAQRIAYISNWDSREWTQTNWSGGTGQTQWSDATKYSSGANVNHTVTGQMQLATAADGTWALSGGTTVTDTSDTDFNQGTYSSTQVTGSGSAGSVTLTQSALWSLHTDTGNETWNDIVCTSASNCWSVGDSGALAQYNGASWAESTIASSANINSVYALSSSDIWSAGANGRLWRYNGTSWSLHTDTGGETWNDIVCTSASNCWSVGDSGALAQYNGASWAESTIVSSANINSVYALLSSNIWAAGASGRIWNYNGTSWSLHTDTGNETWNDIVCTSTSNCWSVGNSGALAQYNGVSWTESTISPTQNIESIYAFSSSNIWAAGANGNIWNYNGTSWSVHTDTGNEDWNSIAFISTSSGWAIGDSGEIFEYGTAYVASGTFTSRVFDSGAAGTTWNTVFWTEVLPSGADVTISTRTGNTATPDGTWSSWSAELTDETGDTITSSTGRYLQYRTTLTRGSVATQTPQLDDISIIYGAATSQHLYGMYVVSASDVWTVGNNGVIVHYNGTSWSLHTDTGGETWRDVVCTSASNCWTVGDSGALAQYNGTSWAESTIVSSANINSAYALLSSNIWAAGASGRIWNYNGTSWSLHTDTGNETWNDIVCTSASNCWAVGDSGALAQYNGTSWAESTIVSSANINSAYALSSSDIWAAGASGRLWHYDGTSWSLHTDTGGEVWNDVYLVNANDGWVVGDSGVIRRWLGTSWNSFTSPTSRNLNAVFMASLQAGWSVSNNGTILRFSRIALYETSGSATSSAFNMSNASPVQAIDWDETIPSCSPVCDITIDVSTAPDSGGSPGVWTGWQNAATPSGTLLPTSLNGNQWVRYRANLTGDGTDTPVLTETRINYK